MPPRNLKTKCNVCTRLAAMPYLILIASVFAVYANVYQNSFLFDDEFILVFNGLLHNWSSLGKIYVSSSTAGVGGNDLFYRPMQFLPYLIIYQFFGLSTIAFHFLNIALHAANACLAYRVGTKIGFGGIPTLLAALIWALHPLNVEAITYMSSTADPLYVFFCLLALLNLTPDFKPKSFFAACPLYLLAMLSKEAAIIFPLLAMATQFLVRKDRLSIKSYLRSWPLWATTALYLAIRFSVIDHHVGFYNEPNVYTENILVRIYTFLATLPMYAQIIVWPVNLHMDRIFPIFIGPLAISVIVGFAMIAAAIAQIVVGRGRRGLALSWGFLWFAASYALETGIFIPVNSFFLEHWMYLPTMGLYLALGQTLNDWLKRNPHRKKYQLPAGIAAIILALALGARTIDQNYTWRDPITFYTHAIAAGSNSARMHNNLGNAYVEQERYDLAIPEFQAAIKSSNDSYAQTRHNLALALLALPDRRAHVDEAIADLNRAIEIDPNFFQSYEMLANVYEWLGDEERETHYRNQALALRKKFHIPDGVYPQPKLSNNED